MSQTFRLPDILEIARAEGKVTVENLAERFDVHPSDAPFLLLPLLGGADRMRGYRKGRFRDDMLWAAQTEYRLPLFWRFKGTAFTSAGEVAPRVGPTLFENVELAAGLGARFQLTDSGLHGRLDVAYSRTGVEFYISVGEAF